MDVTGQKEIDQKMIVIDGTEDKSKLGANAILGVSLAAAKASALTLKTPLFKYLNQLYENVLGDKITHTNTDDGND